MEPSNMEVTLYDGKGRPVAYIADDGESSIYLWNGHAVAYLVGENLYGWNGKHLGWFSGGVLHDLRGYCVGSVGEKSSSALYAEPAKYAKHAKYGKYGRFGAHARPGFKSGYSNVPLDDFLKEGAVGKI